MFIECLWWARHSNDSFISVGDPMGHHYYHPHVPNGGPALETTARINLPNGHFWELFWVRRLCPSSIFVSNLPLFFLRFFWHGPLVKKSVLNLLQYCFCFLFWFFGWEACGVFAPWPGFEPAPFAPEGDVLTTGQPGKSCDIFFF